MLEKIMATALFRRLELQVLMWLTARALQQPAPRLWTLSYSQALAAYARFTLQTLSTGVDQITMLRLYNEANRVGRCLRRLFFLHRESDVQRVIFQLYSNIGIHMTGSLPGSLCIRHCFFAQYYTPEVCRAASALDHGIISGLSGGGELLFKQRIPEGCPFCLATFKISNK